MQETIPFQNNQLKALQEYLTKERFQISEKEHAHFEARKGGTVITAYKKGPKLLVQGKDIEKDVKNIQEALRLPDITQGGQTYVDSRTQLPKMEPKEKSEEKIHLQIGTDESGKGDYFGPLVTAGVCLDTEAARKLRLLGVTDSKLIKNPAKIRKLAAVIRMTIGCNYTVDVLEPYNYNQEYPKTGNLNSMLAQRHAKVIKELSEQVPACTQSLTDQFATPQVLTDACKHAGIRKDLLIDQKTHGESDTSVAAASILAREAFINWIDNASERLETTIPLGAGTNTTETAQALHKTGHVLEKLVKTHFKTHQETLRTNTEKKEPKNPTLKEEDTKYLTEKINFLRERTREGQWEKECLEIPAGILQTLLDIAKSK